jgi:hypothetical protein
MIDGLTQAVQQVSAVFGQRVRYVIGKRGWAARIEDRVITTDEGEQLRVTDTMAFLPFGVTCRFRVRPEPEQGGATWRIDIRRSDGTELDQWAGGFVLARDGQGRWLLHHGRDRLSDALLLELLDDLVRPATGAGVPQKQRQAWQRRFGILPREVATALIANNTDPERMASFDRLVAEASDQDDAMTRCRALFPSERA